VRGVGGRDDGDVVTEAAGAAAGLSLGGNQPNCRGTLGEANMFNEKFIKKSCLLSILFVCFICLIVELSLLSALFTHSFAGWLAVGHIFDENVIAAMPRCSGARLVLFDPIIQSYRPTHFT
jgi:hypothetical protein